MAARISCLIFALEQAKKRDYLAKRRQARNIRNLSMLLTDRDYINVFRLSKELIQILEKDLVPLLTSNIRRGGLSRRNKILCALSFLANGSYQRIIGKNVDTYMSQASASRAIHEVVCALNHPAIVKKYIQFPQNASERQRLKQRFFEKYNIPGVIGCVDGTFVSMIRPKDHEERYYCRKGYHARNVLIINDSDLNIMHVDATFGGATHDNFIFNNSVIKRHLEELIHTGENVYLLGDSGYAQRPYLMTPMSNPDPDSPEELYNKLHSTARNSVERTIGILKGRFRCLLVHRVLNYDPVMVSKIVVACCVLHNICNRAGLPVPALPLDMQQAEMQVIQLLNTHRGEHVSARDDLESGRQFRQRLVNSLWRARQ